MYYPLIRKALFQLDPERAKVALNRRVEALLLSERVRQPLRRVHGHLAVQCRPAGFEGGHKLIPGRIFAGVEFAPAVAQEGDNDPHKLHLLDGATLAHVHMFYWTYFAMTGMHALHMIIGAGLLF